MSEEERKERIEKEREQEDIVLVGSCGSLEFDERFAIFSPFQMKEEGLAIFRGEKREMGTVFFSMEELVEGEKYITWNGIHLERISIKDNNDNDDNHHQYLIQNRYLLSLQELENIAIQQSQIIVEKKKKEEEREKQRKHDATYSVSSFQELPQDIQKTILSFHLDLKNLQFQILINILRFTNKKDFRTYEMKMKHPKLPSIQDHPILGDIIKQAQFSILMDDKAKRFFKSTELTGKGGYGKVFFAEQTKPKRAMVAIKKTPHSNEKQKISNYLEIGCLMTLQHPNIVKYLSSYAFKDELWMITEFMAGGTLSDARKIRPFNEQQIAYVAREILKALEFIHYKELIHRDLKSSNIMLTTNGDVKLIDLGLCDDISNGPLHSMCGSAYYMSPEMIRNEAYSCPVRSFVEGSF
eukprot:TRINITY_DN5251_c0_g1_i1.p1 TRINITY_DN5251_c0_g1~~TRINITY_DN5251_c0_g1_i1.p1  ORF type:complete len:411 (-),score=103.38 TRINITY_DN5251_c0_g1_i1:328-1560(-)